MAQNSGRGSQLASDVEDMRLKEEDADVNMEDVPPTDPVKEEASAPTSRTGSAMGTPLGSKRQSRSPTKRESTLDSPAPKSEDEETVGGEVTLKLEPGKPPKLARSTSHKVERRAPQLFDDYEDKTNEAKSTFSILTECTYANKYLGTTEHALECDCVEEWGKYNAAFHDVLQYCKRRHG